MLRFFRILIAVLLLTVVLSACSRKFKMPRESLSENSTWQFHRLDVQNSGRIEGNFNGKFDVIWENSTGTRPSGPLTLSKGFLVYPDSKKKIRIYEPPTGKYLGYIRTKGHTPTGMVVSDSLGFYVDGPKRVVLRCHNLLNRKTVWEANVKDAVSGSIIVGDKLVLSQTAGLVQAFNLISGKLVWTYTAKERFLVPAVLNGEKIYQTGDDGTLYIIDSDSGVEASKLNLKGPFLGSAAVNKLVYLVNMNGNIYAIDKSTDSVVWESSVTGPVWSSPAVDENKIYITSNSGQLTALDLETGKQLWQFDAKEVIKCSPIIAGHSVLFGTMYGNLYSISSSNGTVESKREFKGAISQSPISDGRLIYVATNDGELVCLGDTSEIAALENQ